MYSSVIIEVWCRLHSGAALVAYCRQLTVTLASVNQHVCELQGSISIRTRQLSLVQRDDKTLTNMKVLLNQFVSNNYVFYL